jgi:hypothetical protein
MKSLNYILLNNLRSSTWSLVDSTSNINEYQKQKNNVYAKKSAAGALPSSVRRLYRPVVPNLWYAYSWEYAADRLGVPENNIGNGGKQQKKELK